MHLPLRSSKTFRPISRALLALATLSLVACGEDDFDPPNKINTVRVLAVKKTPAYARPGESVSLEILYWDGKSKPEEQRSLDITWMSGCENPAGDLYYGCYPELVKTFSSPPSAEMLNRVGKGTSFELTLSSDIVSGRPPPRDGSAPYGLAYVFFTACSGKIGPVTDLAEGSLPIGCYDDSGDALGPDDFVVGYTSIYSYEDIHNENPMIDALLFEGRSESETVRVPRCSTPKCQRYELKPLIDPRSAELDPTADPSPDGKPIQEHLWLNYYATGGSFDHPARLVNDATQGWNEQNETGWEPPREPGTVVIWAVVRDNRGGVDWKERRILVE